MKVLLINPNFNGVVLAPSLGLAYLAEYVNRHSEHEAEVIEPILQGVSRAQVLEKVKQADVVGMVCYTESRFECFRLAREIKQVNPLCRIVVGGPHATALGELILEHVPEIDVIVHGEGEFALMQILQGSHDARGISYRQGEQAVYNLNGKLLGNIDWFDCDPYLIELDWKDMEVPPSMLSYKASPIIASRGCPFQCAFCGAHNQWGKVYRTVTPREVIRRLNLLSTEHGVKYFRFYDALFMGSDNMILEFCDQLERAELGIHFRIDVRVGTSYRALKRLREVGCDIVGFGVESGNDRILKRINKRITREQAIQTALMCRELGYWTIGFFMVGLPDEGIQEVEDTLSLIRLFDVVNVQYFKVHPNTLFYEELKERGEIDDKVWFDPEWGYRTKYGHEAYYCKELFPSARFSFKDVEVLTDYSSARYNCSNPRRIIERDGRVRGAWKVLLSEVLSQSLRYPVGHALYKKYKACID